MILQSKRIEFLGLLRFTAFSFALFIKSIASSDQCLVPGEYDGRTEISDDNLNIIFDEIRNLTQASSAFLQRNLEQEMTIRNMSLKLKEQEILLEAAQNNTIICLAQFSNCSDGDCSQTDENLDDMTDAAVINVYQIDCQQPELSSRQRWYRKKTALCRLYDNFSIIRQVNSGYQITLQDEGTTGDMSDKVKEREILLEAAQNDIIDCLAQFSNCSDGDCSQTGSETTASTNVSIMCIEPIEIDQSPVPGDNNNCAVNDELCKLCKNLRNLRQTNSTFLQSNREQEMTIVCKRDKLKEMELLLEAAQNNSIACSAQFSNCSDGDCSLTDDDNLDNTTHAGSGTTTSSDATTTPLTEGPDGGPDETTTDRQLEEPSTAQQSTTAELYPQ